jgi:hypothetical protein
MTWARNVTEQRERREAEREANLRALVAPTRSLHRGTYGSAVLTPAPKPDTPRSESYRRLVAQLPCIHCGREGQTQAAHPNDGKGMAIKASDLECFPLCVECHREFDQGAMFPKAARRDMERVWAEQTRLQLGVTL